MTRNREIKNSGLNLPTSRMRKLRSSPSLSTSISAALADSTLNGCHLLSQLRSILASQYIYPVGLRGRSLRGVTKDTETKDTCTYTPSPRAQVAVIIRLITPTSFDQVDRRRTRTPSIDRSRDWPEHVGGARRVGSLAYGSTMLLLACTFGAALRSNFAAQLQWSIFFFFFLSSCRKLRARVTRNREIKNSGLAGHKIRLQIEKSPFPHTVPGLHHKKPAEVRLDKKDVIMRLKE